MIQFTCLQLTGKFCRQRASATRKWSGKGALPLRSPKADFLRPLGGWHCPECLPPLEQRTSRGSPPVASTKEKHHYLAEAEERQDLGTENL